MTKLDKIHTNLYPFWWILLVCNCVLLIFSLAWLFICLFFNSPSVANDSSPSREQNWENDFSPLIGGGGRRPEGVIYILLVISKERIDWEIHLCIVILSIAKNPEKKHEANNSSSRKWAYEWHTITHTKKHSKKFNKKKCYIYNIMSYYTFWQKKYQRI